MLSADPSTRRQRSLRLEAIVLKHSDWGEADRLVNATLDEAGLKGLYVILYYGMLAPAGTPEPVCWMAEASVPPCMNPVW